MSHEIEKIESIASRATLEESHVQHLFTLTRKLIERVPKAERSDYSLLKFYCDWTLHTEIDRSKEGESILAQIHNILKKTDNTTIETDLTNALSLDTARDQINKIISRFGGKSKTFSQTKWSKIIPILAEIISHCPLKFGKSSKILKSLKEQPLMGTSVVEKLEIIKVSSSNFKQTAPAGEMIFCFSIGTDTTDIIVRLVK